LPVELHQRARDLNKARRELISTSDLIPEEVRTLVERREIARARKEWAKADALRNELAELGYQLSDTPMGPHILPID
jgi:cysteinyl-tRNA synthetase